MLQRLVLRSGYLRRQRHHGRAALFALLAFLIDGLWLAIPGLLVYQRCVPVPAIPAAVCVVPGRRVWAGSHLLVWSLGPGRWRLIYADELGAADFARLRRLLVQMARSRGPVALTAADFERV